MTDTSPPAPSTQRYQTTRYSRTAILAFFLILVGSGLVFYLLLFWFQNHLMAREHVAPPDPHSAARAASEPRLQPSRGHTTNDWEDYAELRASQSRAMNSYKLLSEAPGYARIPIERAMTLRVKNAHGGSPNPGVSRP